jgi:hypothetical protein
MSNFVQASLPVREAIAAWAAAASTAGAHLPNMVSKCLTYENWEGGACDEDNNWSAFSIVEACTEGNNGWDAFNIVEACTAACRNIYQENVADPHFPMPRGMDLRIFPEGNVFLVWESDSHTITLKFVARRRHWSVFKNEKVVESPGFSAILMIDAKDEELELEASPRVAAAVAASFTLQTQGWN